MRMLDDFMMRIVDAVNSIVSCCKEGEEREREREREREAFF
jgi:hypothetical protein